MAARWRTIISRWRERRDFTCLLVVQPAPPPPRDLLQIPIEVILGPVGALGLALLWIWDLRKQRDDAIARLNRIIDKFEATLERPR